MHPPLRVFTFLAPKLLPFYRFVCDHIAERLGIPTSLVVGESYDELRQADVAFVCGLAYVELTELEDFVQPIAAPVLAGKRYGGRPIYFSDVIVRRDSRFRTFGDLRGCSWAYNEPHSQSGYGVTRYALAREGEGDGYFGRVVEAGWHERSIRLVASGEVDASAIDSHVLEVVLRDEPSLAEELRVIDTLGPSSIQPVVVARHLPAKLKAELQCVLLEMVHDLKAQAHLTRALVARFTAVTDSTYDDIRDMLALGNKCLLVGTRSRKYFAIPPMNKL